MLLGLFVMSLEGVELSQPGLDRWVATQVARRSEVPEIVELRTSFGRTTTVFLFESQEVIEALVGAPDERSRGWRHLLPLDVATYGGMELYYYKGVLCDAKRLPFLKYVNGVKID